MRYSFTLISVVPARVTRTRLPDAVTDSHCSVQRVPAPVQQQQPQQRGRDQGGGDDRAAKVVSTSSAANSRQRDPLRFARHLSHRLIAPGLLGGFDAFTT